MWEPVRRGRPIRYEVGIRRVTISHHLPLMILCLESVKFFVESPQCKHIVLGCCHDSGSAAFLGQFVSDKSILERITLLEGNPVRPSIRGLGFKTATQFLSLFAFRGSPNGNSTSPPGVPKYSYSVPPGQFERLGPISVGNKGRRADRPLSAQPEVVERMKRFNLCHWLFLR